MHPQVISAFEGNCSICGMALENASTASAKPMSGDDYTPLLIVIAMIVVVTGTNAWRTYIQTGTFSWETVIVQFMTAFFLVFAGFKLMDLKGFAEGYTTYDLLAQRVHAYGYVYPFIELAFGLTMLAGLHPTWLLLLEAIVMVFSGLGVAIKLAKREPFRCACLGTFLKVPLTYVTLIEDFGMAALALLLILIQ